MLDLFEIKNTSDLLMFVGKEFYRLHQFISEAQNQGVSKRIPESMIPSIIPGRTRLFLAYPEVIVLTSDYRNLTKALLALGYIGASLIEDWDQTTWIEDPATYIPTDMLTVRIALELCETEHPEKYAELVQKYSVSYQPGIFAFTYLTGIQYVCKDGEENLPNHLSHFEGTIEPVIVVHLEESNG